MKQLIKDQSHEFLTTPEVARLLRLSIPTIHHFINDGLLARIKLGKRVFIHVDDLMRFVNERYQIVRKEGANIDASHAGQGTQNIRRQKDECRSIKDR